jgi:archaellum biogenesis ATPase FlaH
MKIKSFSLSDIEKLPRPLRYSEPNILSGISSVDFQLSGGLCSGIHIFETNLRDYSSLVDIADSGEREIAEGLHTLNELVEVISKFAKGSKKILVIQPDSGAFAETHLPLELRTLEQAIDSIKDYQVLLFLVGDASLISRTYITRSNSILIFTQLDETKFSVVIKKNRQKGGLGKFNAYLPKLNPPNSEKLLKTNISDLDKELNGGWERGECVLITGPTNSCKTALALSIGCQFLKQGKSVVHLTDEDDEFSSLNKYLSNLTHVKLENIFSERTNKKEKLLLKEVSEKYADQLTIVSEVVPAPDSVDDSVINERSLEKVFRKLFASRKFDALIVDWMMFFFKSEFVTNQFAAGTPLDNFNKLSELAKELGFVLIVTLQTRNAPPGSPIIIPGQDNSFFLDSGNYRKIHQLSLDYDPTKTKNKAILKYTLGQKKPHYFGLVIVLECMQIITGCYFESSLNKT